MSRSFLLATLAACAAWSDPGHRGSDWIAAVTAAGYSSGSQQTGRNQQMLSLCRYERYAWGQDELMPTRQVGKNSFAGMGATLLDGLSTLWLMDLKEEFYRGRDWVATNLTFPMDTVGFC